MNLEMVIYEVKDHITKITMNRPEKRNVLNHQLLSDLDAAFVYHRQLNAMWRVGRKGTSFDLDVLRRRTKGQQI